MRTVHYIHPVRLGVTIGLIWCIAVVLLALVAKYSYAPLFFRLVQEMYIGCGFKTCLNVLVCALFGFADGFIGGALVGLIYNWLPIDY